MKHGWLWITLAASAGAALLIHKTGTALPDAPLVWPPITTPGDEDQDYGDEPDVPVPTVPAPEPIYGGFAL